MYYTLNNGSVVDKSHLTHMIGDASKLGIKDVEFVFDKGFVTADNPAYIKEANLRFLAPCEGEEHYAPVSKTQAVIARALGMDLV